VLLISALMQQPSLLLKSSRRVRQAAEQAPDARTPKQFLSMFVSSILLTSNSLQADEQYFPCSFIGHPLASLVACSIVVLPQVNSASMVPCDNPVEHAASLIRAEQYASSSGVPTV
jgi:hypothetical protein